MVILRLIVALLRALFRRRAVTAAENIALRQQLIILQRSVTRPKLRNRAGSSGPGCPGCGPAGDQPC